MRMNDAVERNLKSSAARWLRATVQSIGVPPEGQYALSIHDAFSFRVERCGAGVVATIQVTAPIERGGDRVWQIAADTPDALIAKLTTGDNPRLRT
jgi:hypothetical protein